MLEQSDIFVDSSQTDVLQLGEELCSVNLIWSLIEAVSIRPSSIFYFFNFLFLDNFLR